MNPSFAAVSLPKLKEELLALRLEMIGTAWTYESKVEAALAVSETTKAYLAALGRLDLWEAMGGYNLAVAEAATAGADPKRGTDRAWLTMVNHGRADLFDKWHQGRDGEAVARVANRIHSEGSLKSRNLQAAVALQAIHRLEIEGLDAILIDLAATERLLSRSQGGARRRATHAMKLPLPSIRPWQREEGGPKPPSRLPRWRCSLELRRLREELPYRALAAR